MTLLDRFRSQPPHKHPDVSVRLSFLADLPIDDRQTIGSMAREDADARVRRAAVAKLMDVDGLAAVARSDTDESVRGGAAEMLRDIAVEAFEGIGDAESIAAVEALEALGEIRALAHVARQAPSDRAALRALSSIAESRMLGSIARHAVTEAARVGALAALRDRGDAAEMLAVALNGEYKETAVSAVEGLAGRAELEMVAARARNKNAVKRARVILRELEERAVREAAEQAAAAAEATRVAADAHAQEVLPMSTDALLDPTPSSALAVSADNDVTAPGSVLPVDATATPPPAAPAEPVPQEAPVAAPSESAVEAGGAVEPALAESVPADSVPLDAARHQAECLAAADAAVAAAAIENFAEARAKMAAARREWIRLTTLAPADEAASARYAEAEAAVTGRETAAQDAEARTRREGLARMHNLLGRVEQLSVKPDISLKAADRALRDVRAALAAIPPLPSKADYEDVHTRLKALQDALAPRVHELREADEWQKWANVTIQEQLCAKMEALNALEDAEAIAREVRELQQQWRAAADVPRDKADVLWKRFKTAHDTVWARCEAHFAAEAQARSENLARKTALCEQAEALTDSSNWIQTAESIKRLQAEWKTIGPVSRGREKAIWDRFRSACDAFFTRRNADLAQRKEVWATNLARKDALCVRAEALAESTEWDAAAAEIKQLQAEWKAIGPVKKSRSEAIWQRFRSACDRFFERYAQRHHTARAERVAAREAICAELEALAAANEGADAPADLLSTVRSLRGRWQAEIAARGVDPDRARALDARFNEAFGALIARWPAAFAGTDLDPDANRKRMEALVKKMEDLAASLSSQAAQTQAELSPVNRLAAMLKEALAANTIGGKPDDDSRWRAAAEEARQAQAAWSRLGPVSEPARGQLADRFQRAFRKITDRIDAASRQGNGGRGPGRSGGSGRAGSERGDRPRSAGRPREAAPETASTEK
ncbi:MAG: DUF349 domain-containing protein [Vicinamibacterales bacterium]